MQNFMGAFKPQPCFTTHAGGRVLAARQTYPHIGGAHAQVWTPPSLHQHMLNSYARIGKEHSLMSSSSLITIRSLTQWLH